MRTSGVVEVDVNSQNTAQMRLIEDEDFVQPFFADGAHPALDEGIGIGRANRGVNDLNVLGLENGVEGGSELHKPACVFSAWDEAPRSRLTHRLRVQEGYPPLGGGRV